LCDTQLVRWDPPQGTFELIDLEGFATGFVKDFSLRDTVMTGRYLDAEDLPKDAILVDMDANWMGQFDTESAYGLFHNAGAKVVRLLYDVVPVLTPQYQDPHAARRFLQWLPLVLGEADLLLVNTSATRDDVASICAELEIDSPPIMVVPLGSDIPGQAGEDIDPTAVSDEAVRAAQSGPFVLMVGTVEPRKNHAYVIDAFEAGLFERGVSLVVAGRRGWENDALIHRLDNHPQLGKRLFFLDDASDTDIAFLYDEARFLAFPSRLEGYGLPIVEALERGLPVLAADTPVSLEVGGDWCDYFSLDDVGTFSGLVEENLDDELYKMKKARVATYRAITWAQSASAVKAALDTLQSDFDAKYDVLVPSQLVVLTARLDDVRRMLPFVDHMMPFVDKVLVCCPDDMMNQVEESFGRLKVSVLGDSELLQGKPLPDDHGTRNFMLRCMMMQNPKVNDVFIMSDDDYRPLDVVDVDTFVAGGCYQAYYQSDIRDWQGKADGRTSYDEQQVSTLKFLEAHDYPTLQYSCHMPQVIDKRIYNEFVATHDDVEGKGLDEWSAYFNYATFCHPALFKKRLYLTMCWPPMPWVWPNRVAPNGYLFENYYPANYDGIGVFRDFERDWHEEIGRDNAAKTKLMTSLQARSDAHRLAYGVFEQTYRVMFGRDPKFFLRFEANSIVGETPSFLVMLRGALHYIAFEFDFGNDQTVPCELRTTFIDSHNDIHENEVSDLISYPDCRSIGFPVRGPAIAGEYVLCLRLRVDGFGSVIRYVCVTVV